MDTKHNPEFTTVELYEAFGDLQSMRELSEGVIKSVAKNVIHKDVIEYDGHEIDLSKPFRWVSMAELIKEKTGIDFTDEISYEQAVALAKEHHIEVEPHHTGVGHIMNEFFEKYCEEDLIQPTFVYGHPIEISPLTKKGKDPRFTERFELYVAGFELANAYTELNDPIDQRERFEAQLKAKELGDDEANEMDLDFLESLEYGMPPAGGIGMGIDRFVMFLLGQKSVREVILFPCMKDR
jgi:lysyl-tRNA synthetase class 2